MPDGEIDVRLFVALPELRPLIEAVDNALSGVGVVVADHHQTKCPVHGNAYRVLRADLQTAGPRHAKFRMFILRVCDEVLGKAKTRPRWKAAARLSENRSGR